MELTLTDTVFSRIAMVLFMCRNKSCRNDLKLHGTSFENNTKSLQKMKNMGPTTCPRGWGATPYLVGRLELLRPQLQLYIFAFGEKKIKEKDSSRFTIRSRRQALKPLGRVDPESVRGSGEGDSLSPSSSSTILHHQFHDAHRRA